MSLIEKYQVVERTSKVLETKTKLEALKESEEKYNEINDNWNNFSYDCCGHAYTFYKLQIEYLKELIKEDI